MGDTLWTSMQPYLVGIGGGLFGGAALALTLILSVRLLARAFRRSTRAVTDAAASGPVRPDGGLAEELCRHPQQGTTISVLLPGTDRSVPSPATRLVGSRS